MYRRIGVAVTFSPRFLAVLAEAGSVCRSLSASLYLIHADEYNTEKEARFREALHDLALDEKSEVHFEPGQPVESILKAQRDERIDLLIAGALETESIHRNFTGNVARELLKKAPCDLLLFTEPREKPEAPTEILVAIPDFSELSKQVFHQAVNLAERRGTPKITVVHVQTTFAEAKEKVAGATSGAPSSEVIMEELLNERESSKVELDYHLLRGNTGFTACEFIQSSGADLLVMPSDMSTEGQAAFAPALDWIIQVIPTNLWVIRRISPESEIV